MIADTFSYICISKLKTNTTERLTVPNIKIRQTVLRPPQEDTIIGTSWDICGPYRDYAGLVPTHFIIQLSYQYTIHVDWVKTRNKLKIVEAEKIQKKFFK